MATGDGGLLVLGGSSGSLVVSLHGLVVSVVSCSSLPRLPLVSSFFFFFFRTRPTVSPLPVSLWPKSPQKFHARFLISILFYQP